MKQAALTINLPKEKWGFFTRVPSYFGAKGTRLSPSARAFAGRVYGVTKTEKNPDAALWTNYDQIEGEFGVCRATVASSLNALKECDIIEEGARSKTGTSYKFTGKTGRRYNVVPLYLYTADVAVDGIERRLTKAQVLLLGYMMTESRRPKNNGKCEGSVARFARELSLSETTIKKAIKTLLKARLIFRAAEDKGINGAALSRYVVARELFEYERFRKVKAKKATSKDKAQAAADAKAARERYYAERQNDMKERAERYKVKVWSTAPALKQIDADLRALAPQIARAELDGNAALLQFKAKRLEEERATLLQRFGIEERRMQPLFYARCKKCHDSGVLPNGAFCKCHDNHAE